MKETRKAPLIFLVLALFLLLAYVLAPPQPAVLVGSHVSGTGPGQLLLSVDQEDQFFYTDQEKGDYILGRVEALGEDRFRLSCVHPDKEAILPSQEITLDGKGFFLTVRGQSLAFETVDDVPLLAGDVSRYS